jgi:probable rRNA maturation factor
MPISVATPASGRTVPRGVARALDQLVRAALAVASRRPGTIAIVLTGDAELRRLNAHWRGIDRATDVLSFPYADMRGRVDGDLVVSLERLRAQARRYRVTEARELARLVVHGALHLAGLDHHREAERRHMRAQERQALRGGAPAIAALERAWDAGASGERRDLRRRAR